MRSDKSDCRRLSRVDVKGRGVERHTYRSFHQCNPIHPVPGERTIATSIAWRSTKACVRPNRVGLMHMPIFSWIRSDVLMVNLDFRRMRSYSKQAVAYSLRLVGFLRP